MQELIFQLKLAFQLRDSFWWLSFKGEPIVGTSLLLSKEWKVGSDQLCLVIHSWFITLRGWFYKIRLKLEGWSNQMGPISHFIHCYWTGTGALPMTPLLSASPPTGVAFVTGLGTKEMDPQQISMTQIFFILWSKCRLCFSVLGFHSCHAWIFHVPLTTLNPNHSL